MSDESIREGKVVGIHYTLTFEDGEQVDTSRGQDPLQFLHGAHNIVPGLEKALEGRGVGEIFDVTVPASEGYGPYLDEGKRQVERSSFPDDMELAAGMAVAAHTPEGQTMTVWILEADDEHVTIDLNHPLAGKTLCFSIEVMSMRDATDDEKEHGHAHGAGGHHH